MEGETADNKLLDCAGEILRASGITISTLGAGMREKQSNVVEDLADLADLEDLLETHPDVLSARQRSFASQLGRTLNDESDGAAGDGESLLRTAELLLSDDDRANDMLNDAQHEAKMRCLAAARIDALPSRYADKAAVVVRRVGPECSSEKLGVDVVNRPSSPRERLVALARPAPAHHEGHGAGGAAEGGEHGGAIHVAAVEVVHAEDAVVHLEPPVHHAALGDG